MSGRSHRSFRTLFGSAALMALVPLLGCGTERSAPDSGTSEAKAGAAVGPPAGGADFWVDPDSDAARQVAAWKRQGRTADAAALELIADRPMALWPSATDPAPEIRAAVTAAERSGSRVLLVAYNIPHRDCGQYSKGGAPSAAAYRAWTEDFAEAIGDHPATVVLEPDAVPHLVDNCTPAGYAAERRRLLSAAVDRLKAQPHTKVYLDAGNPSWISDPGKLAGPLTRSGVARADGFALNVSNFQPDAAVVAYGNRLSAALGGKHYVVDTSRNGNGPLTGRGDGWCNPPGRALGAAPTTRTGERLVDAYLWVKRPGESDGECRGGPRAGEWWPEYALGLARNSLR